MKKFNPFIVINIVFVVIIIALALYVCFGVGRWYERKQIWANKVLFENSINERLIKAIIHVESSGNPKAVSKKGAYGLMQVRWAVWHIELKKAGIIKTKQCLFNPEKNVKAGEYILAKYYKQTGDIEKALIKYSGGARGYIKKVMEAKKESENKNP
jgi:soluble lytic murein transglycosylase-like protein